MMKKMLFLSVVVLWANTVLSQSVNQYKYAYIPSKFSFQKQNNQYNLNVLTKMFMQKYGFESYLESDAAPFEFSNSNCNKVYVDLEKSSNMFVTKMKVLLKDCNGNLLFTSKEGSSTSKEYRVAYNESLRDAFASLAALNYKYTETKETPKPKDVEVAQPKTVVTETAIAAPGTLYAQPIQNGFQLVDSEPKVVMKIYKTSNNDIYAAVRGNTSGVFIPKGNEWFFEYYQNDQLISEKVNVKF